MEGMGSRQSRASSRYASGPSALQPVFCGRVRKWKKKWVTSPSSTDLKRNEAPPLLLCRWTPLSAADELPRRRFRYTPIVPIEKGETKSVEVEGHLENNTVEMGISNSKEEEEEEEAQELNEDEAD